MFLDRQDNRKQVQQAYRKELKEEIDLKRSRIPSNSVSQQYKPQNQTFSLIANIEKEQLERKKKNTDYYDQLRYQIEEQKRIKSQKQAELKKKQQDEENKLKLEQQKLQERYEEEIKNQKKKGKKPPGSQNNTLIQPEPVKRKKDNSLPKQDQEQAKKGNSQNGLNNSRQYSHNMPSNDGNSYQFNTVPQQINLYPNRVQNQSLNYVPRKNYKDNYYKELLGQRRRLQQETNQISQLNRLFNVERYRRKEESRGLQELKKLQKLLDQKNTQHMDFRPKQFSFESGQQLRPINKVTRASTFSQKINKDEWRKLD